MKNNSTQEGILLAASVLAPLGFAVALAVAIPTFKPVFAELGAELPLFTVLVMQGFWLILLVPMMVVPLWLLWPNQQRRSIVALVFSLVSSLLFTLVCALGLYLPLFHMSQSVGG